MSKKKADKAVAKAAHVRGTIVAQNFSPKGHVEGVFVELRDGAGVVQLNLPKHATPEPDAKLAVGTTIDRAAERDDDGDSDHPVYVAREPDDGMAAGVVVRFNHARHGEVNGYHLDDGRFVHVKPDGARRYKVRVGDRIAAKGETRIGSAVTVIEATHVVKQVAGAQ